MKTAVMSWSMGMSALALILLFWFGPTSANYMTPLDVAQYIAMRAFFSGMALALMS